MMNVQQARRLLTIIVIVFVLLDIAAAVVLLSPMGRSRDERQSEYEDLRLEFLRKQADARPTKNMDKKLTEARAQIVDFYRDRLPGSYSELSETLGKLANDSHVQLSAISYETQKTATPGMTAVFASISMSGSYAQEMEFINSIERQKKFYILDRLSLATGSEANGGELRVNLRLQTFIRTGAA